MYMTKNKKAVIMGAARSGLAVAELLLKNHTDLFISDIDSEENKKKEINKLQQLAIPYEFGKHSEKIYDTDFVVISPGVSLTSAMLKYYSKHNIPVYSELEVASWFCKSPIIAITGSNGKTTTVSLLADIFKNEMPDTIVAGNVGTPFSSQVELSKESIWAIIEVSSFQLETIDRFCPKIAVILNLSPNHLDRYQSYEEYIHAKLNIVKNLTPDDYLIYNEDDDLLQEKLKTCAAKKITFSMKNQKAHAYIIDNQLYIYKNRLIDCSEILLKGNHNYMNVMAAALAAKCAGRNSSSMFKTLKNFKGVEHRLEYVTTFNGINIINDSKATTVESLFVALASFDTPIILIAGGKDKGSDFSKLNDILVQKVKTIILIGEAKEKMAFYWGSLGIPIFLQKSLNSAVEKALEVACYGEAVLLSPACASFDMFRDFEDRGRQFKQIILQLKNSMIKNEKAEK
jgi:UDP-N-acetylmuramoylalanine--D-glutamate ligase